MSKLRLHPTAVEVFYKPNLFSRIWADETYIVYSLITTFTKSPSSQWTCFKKIDCELAYEFGSAADIAILKGMWDLYHAK